MFEVFSILIFVLAAWIFREIRRAETIAYRLHRSHEISAKSNQFELGKNNRAMDGVLLDRGISAKKLPNGLYELKPTAKFSTEMYR